MAPPQENDTLDMRIKEQARLQLSPLEQRMATSAAAAMRCSSVGSMVTWARSGGMVWAQNAASEQEMVMIWAPEGPKNRQSGYSY